MTERRARRVDDRATDFQRTYDASFSWKTAVASILCTGGLRGCWPMSAFNASGDARDVSGNVQTLSESGDCLYGIDGLAPYVQFDGTADYLSRADESSLSITGTELYVAVAWRGLSMGCWVYPQEIGAEQAVIGKWNENTVDQRSYLIDLTATNFFRARISQNGTAATINTVTSTVAVTADTWYFVSMAFDPSARLAINVNGTMTETVAGIQADVDDNASAFVVGARDNGAAVPLEGRVSLAWLCAMYHEDATTPTDHVSQALYHHTRALYGR